VLSEPFRALAPRPYPSGSAAHEVAFGVDSARDLGPFDAGYAF
jgi:hypothetical protein